MKTKAKVSKGTGIDLFISWSGKRSHSIALELRTLLKLFFPAIEPFVSSEDIRKGQRWPIELGSKLDDCKFGIVVLNAENKNEPWILFETGALSKHIKDSSLYTLLTDGLKPVDLSGNPLSHFQHTTTVKDDVLKMIQALNVSVQSPHAKENLNLLVEKFWPQLEAVFSTPKVKFNLAKPEPSMTDIHNMLSLLMGTVDVIAKKSDTKTDFDTFVNESLQIGELVTSAMHRAPMELLRDLSNSGYTELAYTLGKAHTWSYTDETLSLRFKRQESGLSLLTSRDAANAFFDACVENEMPFLKCIFIHQPNSPPIKLEKTSK